MGHPTVYPTGVTLYDPDRAWNGYTLLQAKGMGALLLDMNGREIHLWEKVQGFPNKILPGGHLLGSRGARNPQYGLQDQVDLIQCDYEGRVVWEFNRAEFIGDPGETPRWMARQHHDYQREGNPVGYYAPGLEPKTGSGHTLVLSHKDVRCPFISDKPLLDDVVYEVDWNGDVVWEWLCSDHVEEMGLSEAARNALCRDPNYRGGSMVENAPAVGDWMHVNSLSALGPNKWHDAGDPRFHPDNLIMDGRETNILFIVDKKTGKIVWQVGPDYERTPELRALGRIIGQHHAHMIPAGLPGAGNILVFDNGGWAGYGAPNPASPHGVKNATRDYSRVLEFDPVTLNIGWQYSPREAGFVVPLDASRFYSPFISSAQRLANGNTLITEGSDGRVFEVTPEHEIVWEYIHPYPDARGMNAVYRAYRVPYEWVPQAEPGPRLAVVKPDLSRFRMPNAAAPGARSSVKVEGTLGYSGLAGDCVGAIN